MVAVATIATTAWKGIRLTGGLVDGQEVQILNAVALRLIYSARRKGCVVGRKGHRISDSREILSDFSTSGFGVQ